jgi:hypothetical protein
MTSAQNTADSGVTSAQTDTATEQHFAAIDVASNTPSQRLQNQRDAFGGLRWTVALCGFFSAIGVAILLLALLGAASVGFGLTNGKALDPSKYAPTLAVAAGTLLIVVLALAFYIGGYAAGRMARFDGVRQGIGVWLLGACATVLLALVVVLIAINSNQPPIVDISKLGVTQNQLTVGGALVFAGTALATLATAAAGGKLGEKIHRKIDEIA